MIVSKRNLFFQSKKFGWMLFCGNSNSFYLIEDEKVSIIKKMFDTGNTSFLPNDMKREFIKTGVILPESDEALFNRLKFISYSSRFSCRNLTLTIAPTMACNFKCIYCYEGNRVKNSIMKDDVMDKIIEFIKRSKCKKLDVVWYGGEPLCAWEKISLFNKKIQSIELQTFKQHIVTNGSLLDEEKIKFFIEKKFDAIQITLDGSEKIHNSRRPMRNGGNSFSTIVVILFQP